MSAKPICEIKTWKQFNRRVRAGTSRLLKRLDDFPRSVLVCGCQRSGTTMLARIIISSEGMVDYCFSQDEELDAALILAGRVGHIPQGRYCFQTTYLNERVYEYYTIDEGHKLIWLIRNPFSVVYSMCYNWRRRALNHLFQTCGLCQLTGDDKRRYERFGGWGLGRLAKACFAYIGKTSQVFELRRRLGPERMMILDYEQLVVSKDEVLPEVYRFIDLPYKRDYAEQIHAMSLQKAAKLNAAQRQIVEHLCMPVYEKAKLLVSL